MFLSRVLRLASHALLEAARRPTDEPVPLQRLVILYVFRELCQGICPSATLGATKE